MNLEPSNSAEFPELKPGEDRENEGKLERFGGGEAAPLDGSTAPAPRTLDEEQGQQPAPAPQPQDSFQSLRRRVDKLFAQKKAAEEGSAAERARADALEARLRELESQLATPRQAPTYGWPQPAPAPVTDGGFNPYGAPPPPPPTAPAFDPRLIAGIVNQAVTPLVQRVQMWEDREAIANQHEQSWEEAAGEFPEIEQPNSELRRLAEQLLRRDPEMARSANGPFRATLMARGLLADRQPDRAQAKRMVGTASAAGPGDGKTLDMLKTEYRQLLDKGVTTFQGYRRLKELRAQMREAEGRG